MAGEQPRYADCSQQVLTIATSGNRRRMLTIKTGDWTRRTMAMEQVDRPRDRRVPMASYRRSG
jgi:hypothetical protein